MTKHILIAALGDHPTVVPAMVKALRDFENIHIDELHLLYSRDPALAIEQQEVILIQQYLQDVCVVHPEPLDFPDPNTAALSFSFLHRLSQIMTQYQNLETHRLYLSVAGGRKNTAVLLALTTQFFPTVQGLYHLIDKLEAKRYPTFPTAEDILNGSMTAEEIAKAMNPPSENMKLVNLPYLGPFADAQVLWSFLSDGSPSTPSAAITLTPQAEYFFRNVFDPDENENILVEADSDSAREYILLVPLGKTPMIATQTYTLLQQQEGVTISAVAILYPRQNPVIDNAANLLKKQFENKGIPFHQFPIANLKDIDSYLNAETYLTELLQTINMLRQQYPQHKIALSLSGGRKGMSALALFAAQRASIDHVYHTLIADPNLERKIENETTYASLQKLATDEERAQRLFLDAYPHEAFTLFPIPIIPFA